MSKYVKVFNQNFRYSLGGVVTLAVLAIILIYAAYHPYLHGPEPTSFYECSHLYPVTAGMPKICRSPLGTVFEEYDDTLALYKDAIHVQNLPPTPLYPASPFTVSGEVLPKWFNGKGLTVELLAGTGAVISSTSAQQWSNQVNPPGSTFVPFVATLIFTPQKAGTQGALILRSGASSTEMLVLPVVY